MKKVILISLSAAWVLGCASQAKPSLEPKGDASEAAKSDAPSQAPSQPSAQDQAAVALSPPQFALDFETGDLKTSCDRGLKRIEAAYEAAKKAGSTLGAQDPKAALAAYNELERSQDLIGGLAELIAEVHPDRGLREAAEQCLSAVKAQASGISLDPAFYAALKTIDAKGLTPLEQRSLELALRELKRTGVDKDAKTREKLKQLKAALVQAEQAFSKVIREDQRKLSFSAEELAGLPEDFIAAHPKNDQGRYELTTAYPDFFPVQNYAHSEKTREKLYKAFLNRGYPSNDKHLKTMLRLRKEIAGLLGYKNWAAYAAADKMVKNDGTIQKFLKEIDQIVRPRMEKERAQLLKRKQKDNPRAKSIETWDRFYYVDRMRAENYAFDSLSVRPYLEFSQVTDGILALYGQLFGVDFVPMPDVKLWHPSVKAYGLVSGGQLIGRFYLDMHPRSGKYAHAAMFPLKTGDNQGQIAEAALVCNFPEPKEGHPALMEHQQVVTYFHEFGHLIHHLMAQSSAFINMNGIRTEGDFVEAPSQLLEEWAWDPEVLGRFAKHIETKAPISADLVKRMRRSSEFGKGINVQRQIYYAALSFFLHTQNPKSLKLSAFNQKMVKAYSPYPYPKGTHDYASFGHLTGYSSVYYTYQWSLALAKDMFTRFEKEGLLNPETARAYRESVLLPGATKDAKDLVKDFLGRESNLDAYKSWLQKD